MGYSFGNWLRSVRRPSPVRRPSVVVPQPPEQPAKQPEPTKQPEQSKPAEQPEQPKPEPQPEPIKQPEQPKLPRLNTIEKTQQIVFLEALLDSKVSLARRMLAQWKEAGLPPELVTDYEKDIAAVQEKLPDQYQFFTQAGLFEQADLALAEIDNNFPAKEELIKRKSGERVRYFRSYMPRIAPLLDNGEHGTVKCFEDEMLKYAPEAIPDKSKLLDFKFEKKELHIVQMELRRGLTSGNTFRVKAALKCGADPNEETPALHLFLQMLESRKRLFASASGPSGFFAGNVMNILHTLVEAGAQPGLVLDKGKHAGCDTIPFALELNYYPVLVYLIRHGGSPNSVSLTSQVTPLQLAMQNDDPLMVKYLLLKGARVPPEQIQQRYSSRIQEIFRNNAFSQ